MSALPVVDATGCPGDAAEKKTASLAIVTPTERKPRRVVFMFESPENSRRRRRNFELYPTMRTDKEK
jgi:hypothetical protein